MNWHYITGFFDADGSITLSSPIKNKPKMLQISFHNNELSILNKIRDFIEKELGYKGSLVCKKARKSTHKDSFDLKYDRRAALSIANKMNSIHTKKKWRIKIFNLIQELIPRNGKYSNKALNEREKLEEKFWNNPE